MKKTVLMVGQQDEVSEVVQAIVKSGGQVVTRLPTAPAGLAAAGLAALGRSRYFAYDYGCPVKRPAPPVPAHLQEAATRAKEKAVADAETRRQRKREKRIRLAQNKLTQKEKV